MESPQRWNNCHAAGHTLISPSLFVVAVLESAKSCRPWPTCSARESWMLPDQRAPAGWASGQTAIGPPGSDSHLRLLTRAEPSQQFPLTIHPSLLICRIRIAMPEELV